jgi:peptide/nickel transport system permease protein
MMKNKMLWMGGLLVIAIMIVVIVGPYFPFVDLEREYVRYGSDKKIEVPPYPPSELNPIGSDANGIDLLSRIIVGAKETVVIVLIIAIVRFCIGVPLGIIAALVPNGRSDRLLDAWNKFFYGIPTLFAVLLILRLPFIANSEHRNVWFVIVISFIEVGRVGELFKKEMISLSKLPFLEAGIMIGNGPMGLLRRYYIPHMLPSLIVNFVIDLGKVMLVLGQLGFLSIFINQFIQANDEGFHFVVNQSNSWPAILAESRKYIRTAIWVPFWAATAIAFSVFAFNMFGEGLRRKFERRNIYYR